MLKLLAFAPEDGWAFIGTGGKIKLVRPPYTLSNWVLVDERAVERAVHQYGFHTADQTFSDWAELIMFLNERVRESRLARRKPISEEGLGAKLLDFAPAEIISNYLQRIESELLPEGEWDAAERLLVDMLSVEGVKTDQDSFKRVVELLRRTREVRIDAESPRRELVEASNNLPDRFPRLVVLYGAERFTEYNQRITKTKQLFQVK